VLVGVTLSLVVMAWRAKKAGSIHGWRLVALAGLALGLLPQALQRSDTAHLSWVSCVAFGLLPCFVAEMLRLRRVSRPEAEAPTGWRARLAPAALAAPLALMLLFPAYTYRWYADYVAQTFGQDRVVANIAHRGRDFYYGRPAVAEAAEQVLADVELVSEPGDTLIVGTGDLRKTPYSEAFLYYLLPQTRPGTRYIEMDPGVANRSDSGLADDLESSDLVILSSIRDDWVEPNAALDFGSDEPNQVLQRDFCMVGSWGQGLFDRGLYELYERCDRR
jgi:hypothetical protein